MTKQSDIRETLLVSSGSSVCFPTMMSQQPTLKVPENANRKTFEKVFFYACMRYYFRRFDKRHISYNRNGKKCLSVGTGSRGHDVAAAGRGPTASHDSSKVQRVHSEGLDPQIFCEIADYHLPEFPHTWPLPHISGLYSPATSTQLHYLSNNDSKYSCCAGNKPARM